MKKLSKLDNLYDFPFTTREDIDAKMKNEKPYIDSEKKKILELLDIKKSLEEDLKNIEKKFDAGIIDAITHDYKISSIKRDLKEINNDIMWRNRNLESSQTFGNSPKGRRFSEYFTNTLKNIIENIEKKYPLTRKDMQKLEEFKKKSIYREFDRYEQMLGTNSTYLVENKAKEILSEIQDFENELATRVEQEYMNLTIPGTEAGRNLILNDEKNIVNRNYYGKDAQVSEDEANNLIKNLNLKYNNLYSYISNTAPRKFIIRDVDSFKNFDDFLDWSIAYLVFKFNESKRDYIRLDLNRSIKLLNQEINKWKNLSVNNIKHVTGLIDSNIIYYKKWQVRENDQNELIPQIKLTVVDIINKKIKLKNNTIDKFIESVIPLLYKVTIKSEPYSSEQELKDFIISFFSQTVPYYDAESAIRKQSARNQLGLFKENIEIFDNMLSQLSDLKSMNDDDFKKMDDTTANRYFSILQAGIMKSIGFDLRPAYVLIKNKHNSNYFDLADKWTDQVAIRFFLSTMINWFRDDFVNWKSEDEFVSAIIGETSHETDVFDTDISNKKQNVLKNIIKRLVGRFYKILSHFESDSMINKFGGFGFKYVQPYVKDVLFAETQIKPDVINKFVSKILNYENGKCNLSDIIDILDNNNNIINKKIITNALLKKLIPNNDSNVFLLDIIYALKQPNFKGNKNETIDKLLSIHFKNNENIEQIKKRFYSILHFTKFFEDSKYFNKSLLLIKNLDKNGKRKSPLNDSDITPDILAEYVYKDFKFIKDVNSILKENEFFEQYANATIKADAEDSDIYEALSVYDKNVTELIFRLAGSQNRIAKYGSSDDNDSDEEQYKNNPNFYTIKDFIRICHNNNLSIPSIINLLRTDKWVEFTNNFDSHNEEDILNFTERYMELLIKLESIAGPTEMVNSPDAFLELFKQKYQDKINKCIDEGLIDSNIMVKFKTIIEFYYSDDESSASFKSKSPFMSEIKNAIRKCTTALKIIKDEVTIREYTKRCNPEAYDGDYSQSVTKDKLKPYKDKNLFNLNLQINDDIRWRVLKDYDPYIWSVGDDTNCCQTYGGYGHWAAVDSYINKLASVVVLEINKGDEYDWSLVAQCYFHYVPEDNGYILDNIEGVNHDKYQNLVTAALAKLADHCKNTLKANYLKLGIQYSYCLDQDAFEKIRIDKDNRFFAVSNKFDHLYQWEELDSNNYYHRDKPYTDFRGSCWNLYNPLIKFDESAFEITKVSSKYMRKLLIKLAALG